MDNAMAQIVETHKAVIGGTVILPCSTESTAENGDVFWRYEEDKVSKVVLEIIEDKDNFQDQSQEYRGRVTGFSAEFAKGNFSIELRDVKLSDSGTYTCSLPKSRQNVNVQLSVEEVFTTETIACKTGDGTRRASSMFLLVCSLLYSLVNSSFIRSSFSQCGLLQTTRAQYRNTTFNKTFSLQSHSSLFIHNISTNKLGVYYFTQTGSPPNISSGIRLYIQSHSAGNQTADDERIRLWRNLFIMLGMMNLPDQWQNTKKTVLECVFFFLIQLLMDNVLAQVVETRKAVVGGTVILPCSTKPTAENGDVFWRYEEKQVNKVVLNIIEGKENFQVQSQEYRGRVTGFSTEFAKRNFSIELRDVKLSDAGTYTCSLPKSRQKMNMFSSLQLLIPKLVMARGERAVCSCWCAVSCTALSFEDNMKLHLYVSTVARKTGRYEAYLRTNLFCSPTLRLSTIWTEIDIWFVFGSLLLTFRKPMYTRDNDFMFPKIANSVFPHFL
ncbi:uncharacterized protein LOC132874792 [Neoarius graeffei]|uniref:uncharacterized protein LOC132874792 n=1 Tax=Neoarius graeffei TaxID=443677 RepID=UPI00298BF5E8|nr:uncharacterized protein LOC132874792 [Neoarius graeffei]